MSDSGGYGDERRRRSGRPTAGEGRGLHDGWRPRTKADYDALDWLSEMNKRTAKVVEPLALVVFPNGEVKLLDFSVTPKIRTSQSASKPKVTRRKLQASQ